MSVNRASAVSEKGECCVSKSGECWVKKKVESISEKEVSYKKGGKNYKQNNFKTWEKTKWMMLYATGNAV